MAAEFRHEYKYQCTAAQLDVERARLRSLLRPDPHAGPDGRYAIRSVYFDDPADSGMRENEDGTDPRAKYRLRIYNASDQRISLERKAKVRGMTHKDAALVTRGDAEALLRGRIPFPRPEHDPMLRRMLADMRLRVLRPKVLVQYNRAPFVLDTGNVRITLDEQIASSQAVGRFFERDIPLRQVLPSGQGVLEVKWDELLPSWLYASLQLEGLQWTSFSKYSLCRIYNTMGGITL